MPPPAPHDPLAPRRYVGRVFVATRLILFLGALACLFLGRNQSATALLLLSLFMGAWAALQIRHDDI